MWHHCYAISGTTTVLSNETKHFILFLLPQYSQTALMKTSLKGDVNVVEKLLAAGADPNHQNKVRNLATGVMLIHVLKAFVPNKVLHLFLGQ